MTAETPSPPTHPLLRLTDLTVRYGSGRRAETAVDSLSLEVAPGEIVAVVGESGSGKSTTAAAALGLLPEVGHVTGGRIELDGRDLTRAGDREFRRLRGGFVGLVPQDPGVGLNPTLRIGPQVAEAVRARGDVPKRSLDAEVVAVLEAAGLDQPELRARQYPHQLSGGMRQRVLIAIALAGRPRLLVADEPTSALDVTVQKRILDHLENLVRERGIALLIITHDLAVAADRADRVLVLRAGKLVEEGPTAEVLAAPREDYTRSLLAAAPGLRPVTFAVQEPVRDGGADEPEPDLLRLEGISKDFPLPRLAGGARFVRALDDVSLAVPRGATLGLVGESGSGKSTALRIALGLERPTSGRVLFDDQDLGDFGRKGLRLLRRRFQLVQQNPFAALDPLFTVQQSVSEPLVSFRVGTRASRAARAAELLDAVALPRTLLERKPAELSGGQRQRVAIARALALEPDLVLLDEPVSALDVSVQEQILTLLADLQQQLGLTYLFVSHDLAVVARVAHRVTVLRSGQVVETGSTAEVFSNPQAEYTQELLAAVPGRRNVTEAV